MANIPMVKGKQINRLLCLILLPIAVLFFSCGIAFYIGGGRALGDTAVIIAAIFGAFALIYGIRWMLYAKKEAKAQRRIEVAVAESINEKNEGTEGIGGAGILDSVELCIPHEALKKAAEKRFKKITLSLLAAAIICFCVIYGIILFTSGFAGITHLLMVLCFCVVITIPGYVIQYDIYRNYVRSQAYIISLYYDKMLVNDKVYQKNEIRHIAISSAEYINVNSVSNYRRLVVETISGRDSYNIDYRSNADKTLQWENYEFLVEELRKWTTANNVPYTVDYMN